MDPQEKLLTEHWKGALVVVAAAETWVSLDVVVAEAEQIVLEAGEQTKEAPGVDRMENTVLGEAGRVVLAAVVVVVDRVIEMREPHGPPAMPETKVGPPDRILQRRQKKIDRL